MLLLGVIGHPVAHSQSPRLHNWALGYAQIPGAYYAWDIAPEDLTSFVQAVRVLPIHGVSVTIPHKEAICSLVDAITPQAQAVGAANTLLWRGGQLVADNTDVEGFLAPLAAMPPGRALILGAGGVARAAAYGLKEDGWQVTVTARTPERAQTLAHQMGVDWGPWEQRRAHPMDLLVNATPLGMRGHLEHETPWPFVLPSEVAVYDTVYTPSSTRLLREATAQGCRVIPGLAMFIAQAQAQFSRWTGATFPLSEASQLLSAALSPCHG
jgi:shikimate dehydrogenase